MTDKCSQILADASRIPEADRARLKHFGASYGKSQVRLSRIQRHGARHEFIELSVSINLEGEFHAAYTCGDNSKVIATDTMKNTVYVLASKHGVASIESFAKLLVHHFLDVYPHVRSVAVRCEETPWTRLAANGGEHDHAFVGGSGERFTCSCCGANSGPPGSDAYEENLSLDSGLTGLEVLKTTGSGFANFLRDEYTTLPETDDRIFATSIDAEWSCRDLSADWSRARQAIRAALINVFANTYSKSVQETQYEMAKAAFAACPSIYHIRITMPNRHHLLANLAPFGLDNPNEVFVPTSEPFGLISGGYLRADLG